MSNYFLLNDEDKAIKLEKLEEECNCTISRESLINALYSDSLNRFKITLLKNGKSIDYYDEYIKNKDKNVVVYVSRILETNDELVITKINEWRDDVADYLTNHNVSIDDYADLSLVGSLNPRPENVPSGIKLADVLLYDKHSRFDLTKEGKRSFARIKSVVMDDEVIAATLEEWKTSIFQYLVNKKQHTATINEIATQVYRPYNLSKNYKLLETIRSYPLQFQIIADTSACTSKKDTPQFKIKLIVDSKVLEDLSDSWRDSIFKYLQVAGKVDLGDLANLVPRPSNLLLNVRVSDVLRDDPRKRFIMKGKDNQLYAILAAAPAARSNPISESNSVKKSNLNSVGYSNTVPTQAKKSLSSIPIIPKMASTKKSTTMNSQSPTMSPSLSPSIPTFESNYANTTNQPSNSLTSITSIFDGPNNAQNLNENLNTSLFLSGISENNATYSLSTMNNNSTLYNSYGSSALNLQSNGLNLTQKSENGINKQHTYNSMNYNQTLATELNASNSLSSLSSSSFDFDSFMNEISKNMDLNNNVMSNNLFKTYETTTPNDLNIVSRSTPGLSNQPSMQSHQHIQNQSYDQYPNLYQDQHFRYQNQSQSQSQYTTNSNVLLKGYSSNPDFNRTPTINGVSLPSNFAQNASSFMKLVPNNDKVSSFSSMNSSATNFHHQTQTQTQMYPKTNVQSPMKLRDWLPSLFIDYNILIVQGFVNSLESQFGFNTTYDLIYSYKLGQLSFELLQNIPGFKLGHFNRIMNGLNELYQLPMAKETLSLL